MIFLRLIKRISKFKHKGNNVKIGRYTRFYEKTNIVIGDNVYIGPYCTFIAYGGLEIGSGTIMAHKIEIMTRNHNYDSRDLESIPYDRRYIHKKVSIGENVWIGSHVLILPGVTIGEGAVIGMGSVVTKDIPAFAVAGGNPASIKKYRDRELYNKLKAEGKIYLELKNRKK